MDYLDGRKTSRPIQRDLQSEGSRAKRAAVLLTLSANQHLPRNGEISDGQKCAYTPYTRLSCSAPHSIEAFASPLCTALANVSMTMYFDQAIAAF